MNCGRGVALSGAEASSKSDRFPGMNCGRRAALGLDLGGGKKERAVKGREAAKRSAVYPLRRMLFCETGSGQRWE